VSQTLLVLWGNPTVHCGNPLPSRKITTIEGGGWPVLHVGLALPTTLLPSACTTQHRLRPSASRQGEAKRKEGNPDQAAPAHGGRYIRVSHDVPGKLPVVAAVLSVNSRALRKMTHRRGDARAALGELAQRMLPSWGGEYA
jgi:hypothetical protein